MSDRIGYRDGEDPFLVRRRVIIYRAVCKITGKSYIGKWTKKFNHLLSRHKREADRGAPYAFHRAIRKYGWDSFQWSILFEGVTSIKFAGMLETQLIAEYGTKVPVGYNMTDGGDGTAGIRVQWSDESNRKRSEALRGRKFSDERKRNISIGRTGKKRTKPVTPDESARRSAALKGRRLGKTFVMLYGVERAAEIGLKLSAANKGKKQPEDAIKRTAEAQRGKPRPLTTGSLNGFSKINDDIVKDIRRIRSESGLSYAKIAAMFGIDRTNVYQIVHRKTWGHVV